MLPKYTYSLLRIATAGSVDDGKSTLIGRLLLESKAILTDTMESVRKASQASSDEGINLALITDGLKAEREQGITIDVAYRYFATTKRKFIIADTPGHIQYTRNMVTGASTSHATIILVDARKGMVEQTKRHLIIASLLRIPHVVICINKMDLAGWSEEVFENIKAQISDFCTKLTIGDLAFMPISALKGDNVTTSSLHMKWYKGATLLYHLENLYTEGYQNLIDARFPVQRVVRVDDHHTKDFRGYSGNVASGTFRVGDEVVILPSGFTTKISQMYHHTQTVSEVKSGQSVVISMEGDIDISRGDMVAKVHNQPQPNQEIDALLCWFDHPASLIISKKYILKHTTREVKCMITDLLYELDVNTLHRNLDVSSLSMNQLGRIKARTTLPIMADAYAKNRTTGSFILIDENTNNTVAVGMIL